jgi:hypothetical protein
MTVRQLIDKLRSEKQDLEVNKVVDLIGYPIEMIVEKEFISGENDEQVKTTVLCLE